MVRTFEKARNDFVLHVKFVTFCRRLLQDRLCDLARNCSGPRLVLSVVAQYCYCCVLLATVCLLQHCVLPVPGSFPSVVRIPG